MTYEAPQIRELTPKEMFDRVVKLSRENEEVKRALLSAREKIQTIAQLANDLFKDIDSALADL